MQALLLALLLVPPALQDGQDQPLKNWKVQRREANVRTGLMEIVAIIEGDEAIPRNLEKDKEVVDITGLRLKYYTDPNPKKPEQKSEEVRLRSDKGHLDNEKGRVDLWGHVRIEKPPPDGDGTVLEAPEATLFFKRMFVCPVHGGKEPAQGKCPTCRADLKAHTFTTVEAPKTFELTKPDPAAHMTGEGLAASDDLRKMRVERNGCLIMAGNPKDIRPSSPAPAPSPSKPIVTEMRSKGPMMFAEGDDGAITVSCEKEAWIQRTEVTQDGTLMTTVQADAGELLARRNMDSKKEPEPERLTARGHVTMATRDPKAGESTARAESLVWTGSGDFDVAQLEGSVHVESGKNTIRSKSARIERQLGLSTFRDEVSARLVRGKDPDAQPVALKSRTLTMRAIPGEREVQEIEALEEVILEGFNTGAAEAPGRAEADRFFWNQAENHGLLEKRPFVRVVQEESTLLAPRIVLEGSSMIVLKGPKQVVLNKKDDEGKPVRYTIRSDGDIVLDSSGGSTVIRLQDSCAVREAEAHLFADRMTLAMTKDGRGLETLHAWGRVRVRTLNEKPTGQVKENATLFGEWLTYLPATPTRSRTMTLTGSPLAVIDAGRRVATQEQILFYEKVDPDTGQTVQYQEMRGGKRGVRIVVDDRPR